MQKLNDSDVEDAGFTPLAKRPTEPKVLPSKPHLNRGMSFNEETGEKQSTHSVWDSSSYTKLERSRGKTMDRANSFVGSKGASSASSATDVAVAVVDPFSTGAFLAAAFAKKGVRVVQVLSIWDSPVASLLPEGATVEFCATIQHNDQESDQDAATNKTVSALMELPFKILAVVAGAETGVELADRLSHRMKLRSNGEEGSLARRNKYFMGEAVRNAGIRAVKQQICRDAATLNEFINTLPQEPFRCVVKPVQSAGTDDVFLCNDHEEARVAFNRIAGKRNGLGLINDGALVQEYLRGKEYVIDQVSRNGEHKIACIWQYDKRFVNGASFVYFGMKLVNPDCKVSQDLIAYASQILDALGIREGPSHMEVMFNEDPNPDNGGGACLVEVGSRCHGGEGTWINMIEECVGYTMVTMTADVYLNGPMFDTLHPTMYPVRKYCMDCDLVSRAGGMLRGFPGERIIRKMSSYRSITWEISIGSYCPLTIDCFTRPGCAQLVNESEEQLMRDFEQLHQLEEDGLMFDYSIMCPVPPSTGAIVVVDPYSTGTHLAAMCLKWGFKLILVFTQQQSESSATENCGNDRSQTSLTLLAQHGSHYKPSVLIQHNGSSKEKALENTLVVLRKHLTTTPILAIIPGANTGIEVAEQLATRLRTRCNGEARIAARSDKILIQEAIGKVSGLRAIRQSICRTEDDVHQFMAGFDEKSDATVLKPCNNLASSDTVMLCKGVEEAAYAVKSLHNNPDTTSLIQEHIAGKEYIVDGVCRDGIYKITALWECEKKSLNGSDFVPFSMRLTTPSRSVKERAVVEFSRKVCHALGYTQGALHMKVIFSDKYGSPVLVECYGCCHGQDGTWINIARECVGYSQVEVALSCYIRADRFDDIPMEVKELRAEGVEIYLLSNRSGVVKDIIGLNRIRELPSCRRVDMYTQPGGLVVPTSDYYNRVGTVVLVNKDANQLEKDCQIIRQMELADQIVDFI